MTENGRTTDQSLSRDLLAEVQHLAETNPVAFAAFVTQTLFLLISMDKAAYDLMMLIVIAKTLEQHGVLKLVGALKQSLAAADLERAKEIAQEIDDWTAAMKRGAMTPLEVAQSERKPAQQASYLVM